MTFSLTTIVNYKLSFTESYRLNIMLIFYSLCWSLFWSLSCLIVGSFLESLNETTGKDLLFCITAYKKLSGALSCFFFVFLSLTQFLIVVDTFLSFSKFLTGRKYDNEYLIFSGKIIMLGNFQLFTSYIPSLPLTNCF